MELIQVYIGVIKKYAEFEGRARRREYWMFCLCNIIIGIVLGILGQIPKLGLVFNLIASLYSLAVLVPGIAVSVRRLHDTNIKLLLALIPLAGAIILLVYFVQEGTRGENQFGPDPKAA